MSYNKINNIVGWVVFFIATMVYVMTLEPTASFWDCGEFIATAHKLQVGHPPGAPLWMMMARMFGLLAGDNVENVAYFINLFSGLSSSFTILFLFWSITHYAKKIVTKNGKRELVKGDSLAVMAAGAIGALSYTFSDSFWFSAVEGEVYAASSLFTAAVFWLTLKWERIADEEGSDRYLIFIAYLMGLSIGVHLLNLLVIPAIALVYYYKKFEPTLKGALVAFGIGFATLIFVQYGIIQKVVLIASKFEWFFVNNIGLPQHFGVFIFILLILGGVIFGLKKASEKGSKVLYKALMGFVVILFGYSSFAMIVIRSSADTPMDENNPEDVFSLLPYLNREQYGNRPLLYGQTFDAPMNPKQAYKNGQIVDLWKDGNPTIYWDDNKKEYYIADEKKRSEPTYQDEFNMLFPRMYSGQGHHREHYVNWSSFEGETVEYTDARGNRQTGLKPTQFENIRFFLNYQIRHMYWRYFMWNFSGRQNDIQGHGDIYHGNWLSGVPFIDHELVGNQDNLPDEIAENPGRNMFYMLPFILGLIGLFTQLKFAKNDFIVTMVLFLITGLAIIVYLNQYPMQPRERDYAYAASFYAFALWIGLGVIGLYQAMKEQKEFTWKDITFPTLGAVGLGILVYVIELMNGQTNEFSYSLMYIGFVSLGFLALSKLIGAAVKSGNIQAVLALGLSAFIPYNMGAEGWDDHDRSNRYSARDFAINYLESCAPNAIIFTNGDNDTFPLWYVQEVEGIRTDVRVVNLSLLNTDWYITQMKRKAYDSDPVPFSMTEPQYRQGGSRDLVLMGPDPKYFQGARNTDSYLELSDVINKYIKNDKRALNYNNDDKFNYSPSKNLKITISDEDIQKLIETGAITEADTAKVVEEMKWRVDETQLYKNKLMILDLLASNNWERPVYFAITVGGSNYLNLEPYFQLEGLANRVVPIKHNERTNGGVPGKINTDIMYDNFMNDFKWGNLSAEGVYLNEDNRRMCLNFRSNFSSLAEKLIEEGKADSALKVLDKCFEVFPDHKLPYDYFNAQMASSYAKLGKVDKAIEIADIFEQDIKDKLNYYLTLDPRVITKSGGGAKTLEKVGREIQMNFISLIYVYRDIPSMSAKLKLLEMEYQMYGKLANSLNELVNGVISEEQYLDRVNTELTVNSTSSDTTSNE